MYLTDKNAVKATVLSSQQALKAVTYVTAFNACYGDKTVALSNFPYLLLP